MEGKTITAYQGVGDDVLFVSDSHVMARLPSGHIHFAEINKADLELLYYRMGFEIIGEVHGEFDPFNYDALVEQLRQDGGGEHELHVPNRSQEQRDAQTRER